MFLPNDVFNADESGLLFRMMPTRSLILSGESPFGIKSDKERVTVLFITNRTGIYKRKLLLIGKSKIPRCLRGLNLANLPVIYKSGKNSWMNTNLFIEFLDNFNSEMKKENRKVLLILDNCCPLKCSPRSYSY